MPKFTPLALVVSILALSISHTNPAIGQSPPFTQAPPIGADSSAAVLIIITDNLCSEEFATTVAPPNRRMPQFDQ